MEAVSSAPERRSTSARPHRPRCWTRSSAVASPRTTPSGARRGTVATRLVLAGPGRGKTPRREPVTAGRPAGAGGGGGGGQSPAALGDHPPPPLGPARRGAPPAPAPPDRVGAPRREHDRHA